MTNCLRKRLKMPLSVSDLEQLHQNYDRDTAVRSAMSQVPQIIGQNDEVEYISMQLNGKNPIDALIMEGLSAYKANGRSVSGLLRLLMYHYFSFPVDTGRSDRMEDEHGSNRI